MPEDRQGNRVDCGASSARSPRRHSDRWAMVACACMDACFTLPVTADSWRTRSIDVAVDVDEALEVGLSPRASEMYSIDLLARLHRTRRLPRPTADIPPNLSQEHAPDQRRCNLLPLPPSGSKASKVSIQVAAAVDHRAHRSDSAVRELDASAGLQPSSPSRAIPTPSRRPCPEISQFERRLLFRRRRPVFGRKARSR